MKQIEIQRRNTTPKQFYSYCQKRATEKGINLIDWLEFEEWENPTQESDIRNYHKDWEKPLMEICKHKPYNAQFYLQGAYNFILEWDEGIGYCYITE